MDKQGGLGDMKKKLIIMVVLFAMVLNINLGYLQATNYIVNNDDEDIEWNSYDDEDLYIVQKDIIEVEKNDKLYFCFKLSEKSECRDWLCLEDSIKVLLGIVYQYTEYLKMLLDLKRG